MSIVLDFIKKNHSELSELRTIRDELNVLIAFLTDNPEQPTTPFDSNRGLHLIAEERIRQMQAEGYTSEHDDEHDQGQLAMAAACYASPVPLRALTTVRVRACDCRVPCAHLPIEKSTWIDAWPWGKRSDKRKSYSRIEQLQAAGALAAAEIDRILRQGA